MEKSVVGAVFYVLFYAFFLVFSSLPLFSSLFIRLFLSFYLFRRLFWRYGVTDFVATLDKSQIKVYNINCCNMLTDRKLSLKEINSL